MKEGGNTREKLLRAAEEEFMEKGYNQASLRKICRSAGVTTGALYFFFKDKEDLFAALVEKPLESLYHILINHYKKELEGEWKLDFTEDYQMSSMVIEYLYEYQNAFFLILARSQGSRFEKYEEEFVKITTQHYMKYAEKNQDTPGISVLTESMIKWISHVQISSFIYPLMHGAPLEEAKKMVESMVKYQISGWCGLFEG